MIIMDIFYGRLNKTIQNFVGSLLIMIGFPMVSPNFCHSNQGNPWESSGFFRKPKRWSIWGDTDVEDPKSHPRLQDRSDFFTETLGGNP